MTPRADNALTALERARQAQERHERRIDVQLRLANPATRLDTCQSCGWTQANVNNPGQFKRACRNCGWWCL